MKSLYSITSFPRLINPRVTSNLFIAILSALSIILAGAIYEDVNIAITVSITVLLTWAIVKEIAIQNPIYASATSIAVFVILLGFFEDISISLLSLLLILLFLRIVIQPVGYFATPFDNAFVVVLITISLLQEEHLMWVFMAMISFFLDIVLKPKSWHSLSGFVCSAVILIGISVSYELYLPLSLLEIIAFAGLVLVGGLLSLVAYFFETKFVLADNKKVFLNKKRILFGRLLITLCIISLYIEGIIYG